MRIVVQRVKGARVRVSEQLVAEIKHGLLLLVGIGKEDKIEDVERLSKKVANLRIFEDEQGKMNYNIMQIKGEILSVPQFTLCADMRKGNRPGFDLSAPPETAKEHWERFNDVLRRDGLDVKAGVFGANMEVELINDGPVTIIL